MVKFFLNPQVKGYLRELETEFDESSNAVRVELNRFHQAGLLKTNNQGNKKYFSANQEHPMFRELNTLVSKYIGVDKIVEAIISKAGDLKAVYLTGALAKGLNDDLIDLVIVADSLDQEYINQLTIKAESIVHKQIKWCTFTPTEFTIAQKNLKTLLPIWAK